MAEYMLLMHDDAVTDGDPWGPYIEGLVRSGVFRGGSAIGAGVCVRKDGAFAPLTPRLAGFMRIEAEDLDQARGLLTGHPLFEAGGTVEIRELPRTD